MFVRKVSMRLRADSAAEFVRKMDDEVIPLLRKQSGFLDEMTLVPESGKEVYAYSFWESSADAEEYEKLAFTEATKLLASVVEGTIRIHTYVVANSTFHFHKMAAVVAS
jgi:heme-degrading monooxygenase HmoA